jgi:hypothetical protein
VDQAGHDILLADFWNDGPLVGGCIAGGRRYLHINNAADVEPCVFCQLSTDNLHEKTLLEVLRTSKLLASIRKRQPYADNYLRPCMIIDNPEELKAVVAESNPRETCRGGARRLVNDLYPQLQAYAARWKELSDPVWKKEYAGLYRKPVADAHALSASHERQHGATPEAQAAPPCLTAQQRRESNGSRETGARSATHEESDAANRPDTDQEACHP